MHKKYATIDEFCEIVNLAKWRVYSLSRQGVLPLRHVLGKPIKPYQIDLEEYQKLESTAQPSMRLRSLKIERMSVSNSHKKEPLYG